MRVFLLLLFLTSQALLAATKRPRNRPSSDIVPGKFIVEFEPANQRAGYVTQLAGDFVSYVSSATDYVANPYIHYDNPSTFYGVAVDLTPKSQPSDQQQPQASGSRRAQQSAHQLNRLITKLAKGPQVRKVWPSRYVYRTSPTPSPSTLQLQPRAEAVAPPANPNTTTTAAAPRTAHVATGIDIQHRQGNFGAGLRACIIDDPVDFSHPAFNGGQAAGKTCLGGKCRYEGGYDWFGPKTKGDQYLPGPLTLDGVHRSPIGCGHGTHTSGLMAGNDTRYMGAAPDAHLRTYAIFPCNDRIQQPDDGQVDSVILQGVLKAADDDCDVINMSVGGGTWSNEAITTAANRITANGHILVSSAGNDGDLGMNTVICPACGDTVIAVGASHDETIPAISWTISPPLEDNTTEILAISEVLWTYKGPLNNLELFFIENGTNTDLPGNACNNLNATEDLHKKILISGPADCDPDTLHLNAEALKPLAVVVTVNDTTHSFEVDQEDNKPLRAALAQADVAKLYKAWKTNKKLTVSVNFHDPLRFSTITNTQAGQVTDFSAFGPGSDTAVKPDILAPGSKIVSSVPLPALYASFAGTSMSSPVAAGAITLLKAAKGNNVPIDTLRKRIVQTARPVKVSSTVDKLTSVWAQGGGVINVTAAIELTTLVEPYRLSIGDSAARKTHSKFNLTVSNIGDVEQTYTLSHVAAQSLLALREPTPPHKVDVHEDFWLKTPEPLDAEASVTFTPAKMTLAPGKSQTVDVAVTPPADHPRLLAFSGFIKLDSSTPQGTSSVPYAGFSGSFREIPTLGLVYRPATEEGGLLQYPGLYKNSSGELIKEDGTQTSLDEGDAENEIDLRYFLSAPTEKMYCDTVPANWTYKATVPTDIDQDSVLVKDRDAALKFKDVPVVVRNFDFDDAARSLQGDRLKCFAESKGYDPLTGEDKVLPTGEYRLLLRTHRWTMDDYELDSSYDSYLSHSFKYVAKEEPNVKPAPGGSTPPAKDTPSAQVQGAGLPPI